MGAPLFRGAGVISRFISRRTECFIASWLLAAAIASWCSAGELADQLADAYPSPIEPAKWQVTDSETPPVPLPAAPVLPVPAEPQADSAEVLPATPLLDNTTTEEELVPPLGADDPLAARRGVRPYGGGRPDDWPWGCGGSPFRTGPGFCDTWDVGCRWDVAVDGMVMTREDANLPALQAATMEVLPPEIVEQFEYAPGGRVSFISKVPHYSWQMHAGYEGIEEWNAAIVYPKEPVVAPPLPPVFPSEQRTLHYRSSLHSGELNFVRLCHPVWRPYCGVRYVKFDDEIRDFFNEEAPPPLAGDFGGGPLDSTTTIDSLNLFDIENNLIGFQVGLRHDFWRPTRRLSVEGFVNTGVYYNKIKYTNLMGQFTTQEFADDTSTEDFNESRIDRADVVNNDVSELSEISYIAEASISGVCRLNKCWALRAGYQAMWITDLHLAEDAFLNGDNIGRDLFFHGWHAGVEHRR